MKLEVENCIWHAFDYLATENGRQAANKSKLKVKSVIFVLLHSIENMKLICVPKMEKFSKIIVLTMFSFVNRVWIQ